MQTAGPAAQWLVIAAMDVFKVQFDQPGIVKKRSEVVFGVGFWPTNLRDCGADLWRQTVDVVGIKSVLGNYPAARMNGPAVQRNDEYRDR